MEDLAEELCKRWNNRRSRFPMTTGGARDLEEFLVSQLKLLGHEGSSVEVEVDSRLGQPSITIKLPGEVRETKVEMRW